MRPMNTLRCLALLGCLPLATGCTAVFFESQILDFIGPTTVVAVTGNPIVANPGQSVLLDGTSSYQQSGSGSRIDSISAGFTFLWEVTQTPAGAVVPTLTNPTSSRPSFTATTAGIYVITLTVSNSVGSDTSSETVQVQ